MDTSALNLLLAAAGCAIFVVPTLASLVAHHRTQKRRSFSHVARPLLHTSIAFFRGLLIVAVAWVLNNGVTTSAGDVAILSAVDVAIVYGVVFATNGLIVWRAKDRRLLVDAETGFITWKRLSLPFLKAARVAYIDSVNRLHYDDGDLALFGLDKLELRYRVGSNDGTTAVRGDYPKKVISKLAENFNRYHKMFLKYDSETAKDRRSWRREQYERSLEPGRKQAKREASDEAAAEHNAAKQAARLEEEKRKEVERKFRV